MTISDNINLAEVQEISYNILLYFKSLCETLNLSYYLAYGTLLGGVRHRDFIPWDDDIDVWMPRKNYMILLDFLRKNTSDRYKLSTGQYKAVGDWPEELQIKLIDTETMVERYYGNDIIRSYPWIDVFALDEISCNKRQFIRRFKKARFYYQICRCKKLLIKSKSFYGQMNRIIYIAHNKLGLLNYMLDENLATQKLIDVVVSQGNANQPDSILFCNAAVYVPTIEKCFFEKRWFEGANILQFHKDMFPAPSCYDEVLHKIYGDYMKLPPEEKRVGTHYHSIIKKGD